ncbi:hypothetical protein [Streptosporangium saharense]|uniref:hypothetical protein n=1 Tax=Streptosporangium saharense TaxID=1706840 RepID=UPI0033249566
MNFFTAPPPRERKPEKREKRPPWLGPPEDFVGAVAPLDLALFHSETLAVVLTDAVVFPEGARLNVRMAARRSEEIDDETWWDRHERMFNVHTRHRSSLDENIRFGVRFSDGSKATTVDDVLDRTGDWPPPRPDGPVLHCRRSGNSSGSDDFLSGHWPLWLWPLPPPEPFEFAVEWPLFEVPLTFAEVDGTPVAAAAERSHPYWP